MNDIRRRQRGISLLEALVAFAVMAFGMLGLVGVQSTLRNNSDVARQRSEAVRIAQQAIEQWRGFTVLDTTAGRFAYAGIASGSTTVTGDNASYVMTRTAIPETPITGTQTPQRTTIVVDVVWTDRVGQEQSVRLMSSIAGIEPEAAAGVVLTAVGSAAQQPYGRSRMIPQAARNFDNGTSGYIPPGSSGVAWLFDNATGVITICTTAVTLNSALLATDITCADLTNRALLLSGYVRFATAVTAQPTAATLRDPSGTRPTGLSFGMVVDQTFPTSQTDNCYLDNSASTASAYLCAVPITIGSTPPSRWSGTVRFTGLTTKSASVSDATATNVKVCRYYQSSPYALVATALTNQNYVLLRAGDGSTAFACPSDDTPRTLWPHDPT